MLHPSDVKQAEDEASAGGRCDPGDLRERWPSLWSGMEGIGKALERERDRNPDLQSLHECMGDDPKRPPPDRRAVEAARAAVARELGLDAAQAGDRVHPLAGQLQSHRSGI